MAAGWGCQVKAASIDAWFGSADAREWSTTVPLPGLEATPEAAGPPESR